MFFVSFTLDDPNDDETSDDPADDDAWEDLNAIDDLEVPVPAWLPEMGRCRSDLDWSSTVIAQAV